MYNFFNFKKCFPLLSWVFVVFIILLYLFSLTFESLSLISIPKLKVLFFFSICKLCSKLIIGSINDSFLSTFDNKKIMIKIRKKIIFLGIKILNLRNLLTSLNFTFLLFIYHHSLHIFCANIFFLGQLIKLIKVTCRF